MNNDATENSLQERHDRLCQAISVVGSLILPLEDEERVLDVIAEQILRAARIRSLVLALVYDDRYCLEVVRSAQFNNLTEDGRLTARSTSSVRRHRNWQEDLSNENFMMCKAVRTGRVVIVDGKDPKLQARPNHDPEEWEGKVAYFERLQCNSEWIAVLAGACPLDEAETALDWKEEIMPLLELVAAQLKTLRLLKEQRYLPYRPPLEVNLSEREREVLRRVALGEPSADIAEAMDLSPRTVHTYRRRICNKLNRHSQADLTRYAIMTGIIPLTDR